MRGTCGPYINDEELTTILIGWEIDYKNPYTQQLTILLLVLLQEVAGQR